MNNTDYKSEILSIYPNAKPYYCNFAFMWGIFSGMTLLGLGDNAESAWERAFDLLKSNGEI